MKHFRINSFLKVEYNPLKFDRLNILRLGHIQSSSHSTTNYKKQGYIKGKLQ
jgi:hypothetical protein